MANENTNCTACPVTSGTHKPADAVHTEIAEPAGETHLRELTAYRTTVDNQEAELSTLRARCAELEEDNAETARVLGAIHKKEIHGTWIPLVEELRARIAELEAKAQGEAVASIYVTAGGAREFDDWRHPLPVGSNILYTSPAVPAPQAAPAAVEIAVGPCGQCKDSRQPCACQIDTMLKERGLVAVDAEHYAKVSARAKAAPTYPAEGVTGEVTDAMVHAALRIQHPSLYREYLRHPGNGVKAAATAEKEIETARLMIAAALAATPAAPAATDEPPFLQRLRIEQHALSVRQEKLEAFCESQEFSSLGETQRALLERQRNQQHALLQTMNQRINSAAEQHLRSKRND